MALLAKNAKNSDANHINNFFKELRTQQTLSKLNQDKQYAIEPANSHKYRESQPLIGTDTPALCRPLPDGPIAFSCLPFSFKNNQGPCRLNERANCAKERTAAPCQE